MATPRNPNSIKKDRTVPWPDLSTYGFGLRVIVTGLGQKVICPVIRSNKTGEYKPFTGTQHHQALTSCGFRLHNGVYWKDSGAFSLSIFKEPFPEIKRIEVKASSLIVKQPSWASKVWKIGMNNRGEDVYLDFNTRRGVQKKGFIEIESSPAIDSRFLRAFDYSTNSLDENTLAQCCDGFVQEMIRRNMNKKDLVLFSSAVASKNITSSDLMLRDIQDSIEAATHRAVRAYDPQAEVQFDLARRLYDNQPILDARTSSSIGMQQYSTPAPMASVVANIVNTLKPTENKHVLEPCIGTGSLVAPIRGVKKVTGIELDEMRVRSVRGLSDAINVLHGDSTDAELLETVEKVDVVVANPPFGGTKKKMINGTAIQRIDYEIAMRSLDKLKDDGVAVMIVAADSFYPKQAGVVSGGSKYFLNYLYTNYNVVDTVEMAGSLYSSQGAGFPTRMIVVNGRKPEPEPTSLAPENVKIIHDYDNLWSWQSEILQSQQPDLVVIDESKRDVYIEECGSFQAKYKPASQLSSAREALIPKNMASYVFEALTTLSAEFDNVDDYVCKALHMTKDDFKASFSAAQVDAIALAINAMDGNNGMIIGDQTGFGKGRIMAALARYGILSGKRPIFVTGKANLFSDIMRDFKDIHSDDIVRPLILNNDASANILDTEGHSLIRTRTQNADRSEFISTYELPAAYNVVFTTYSQVNRHHNHKANALINLCSDNGMLLLDEAHNAAGDSNINYNVRDMIQANIEVSDTPTPTVYASATAIKTYKNLNIYMESMSLPYSTDEIVGAAKEGGESFLQILNTMLAKEGLIIRREYSMDDVVFGQHKPSQESLVKNHQIANVIPDILNHMAVLSGENRAVVDVRSEEIKDILKALPEGARKGSRMGVQSMNFGSSLHNINRQIMMAMRGNEMAKSVLDDIKLGKKPVIALQNTMDSLIENVLMDVQQNEDGHYIIDHKISISDVLLKSLESLMFYTETDALGAKRKVRITEPDAVAHYETVKAAIHESELLNQVPVTIFDEISHKIRSAGYQVSEVSGRKWTYDILDDGNIAYYSRPKVDRNKEIFNFNNGEADVILLSSSGSTGLSLHASEKFKDQRTRIMHIGQADQNISEFIQMLGRINRNGQVCNPEIKFHTTGIIGEKRELGALISKLASLMASSTANRESNINGLVDNTVDIVNRVGDDAVLEVLMSDTGIAQMMNIKLDDFIDEGGSSISTDVEEGKLSRKFMSSLTLLKPGQMDEDMLDMENPSESDLYSQLYIYKSVMRAFDLKIADLESKGINPFKVSHHDWKAKTISKQLYSGDGTVLDDESFSAPCFIEEVEYNVVSEPLRIAKVHEHVGRGRERHAKMLRDNNYVDGEDAARQLESQRLRLLKQYAYPFKSPDDISDQDVLDKIDKEPHGTAARMSSNIDAIKLMLCNINVGTPISLPSSSLYDGSRVAVVTHMRIPKIHELHRLSSYSFSLAIEGQDHLQTCSATTMMRTVQDNLFGDYPYDQFDNGIADDFDKYPAGKHKERRVLLTGNMIEASMMKAGSLTTYTDSDGRRNTAYVLPKSAVFKAVINAGIKERRPEMVEWLLKQDDANSLTNMEEYQSSKGILISQSYNAPDMFNLVVAGSKKHGAVYFQNSDLLNLLGDFSGNRSHMNVDIPEDKLLDALKIILPIAQGIHVSGNELAMIRGREREINASRAPKETSDHDEDLTVAPPA